MADILLIEPDLHTSYHMSEILTTAGHRCHTASDITGGMEVVRNAAMRQLAILNARLPWKQSVALLELLQEKGWPVLFVTSDPANVAHLHAIFPGNCAVLLAPFDGKRLQTAVDELNEATSRLLTIGSLRLNTESRIATLDGEPLTLTSQEFALLEALMHAPDSTLSRQELLRTAWGYQGIGETRTVDVHIQRLRRKLGASCIETVYKLGYRLKMA